jgi:hypothetical protein
MVTKSFEAGAFFFFFFYKKKNKPLFFTYEAIADSHYMGTCFRNVFDSIFLKGFSKD